MIDPDEIESLTLGADGTAWCWFVLSILALWPLISRKCSSSPMSIGAISITTKSSGGQTVKTDTVSSPSSRVIDPQKYNFFPLVSKKALSHNVTIFRFGLPLPTDVLGLPAGQHIALAFADVESGKDISRSYTPVSTNEDLGYFEVLVKLYPGGKMSTYLANMKIGDTIKARGPKGAMRYQSDMCQRIGMIAGGSGITPMIQILKAVHSARPERGGTDNTEIDLIYANQTYQDIIMKDELDEMVRNDPKIHIRYVLSQPTDDWKGSVGRVGSEMIQESLPAAEAGNKIMLCGPPGMMEAMKTATESLGYEKTRAVSRQDDQVFLF